jgi:hypothetical protein
MAQKKVISMLEFLRTGKLAGVGCGCTTDDVIRVLGKPEINYENLEYPSFCYDDLEIWFNSLTRVVYRMTFRRFRSSWKPKHSHSFEQALPQITRAKVNAWVIRDSIDLETVKRFLKTANIMFIQNHWYSNVKELELPSGVCMLFDPPKANHSRLGAIYIRDVELTRQVFPHYEKGEAYG